MSVEVFKFFCDEFILSKLFLKCFIFVGICIFGIIEDFMMLIFNVIKVVFNGF